MTEGARPKNLAKTKRRALLHTGEKTMCIVHRIVPQGPNAFIRMTYEPTGKKLPSNSELFRNLYGAEDKPAKEKTVMTIRPSRNNQVFMKGTKPILNPKRFKRADDNEPWFNMIQDDLEIELGDDVIEPRHLPMNHDSGYGGSGPRHGWGASYRNAGRKPEYKDRGVRASGSGKARLEPGAYHPL